MLPRHRASRLSSSACSATTKTHAARRFDIMTEKRRWKTYVAIFAATAFVSAIVTPLAIRTFDNFACRAQPHGPDDFLAYCRSLRYGDYEHGALYYGLEPKARESIRAAQVLFLGSSRLQAAFD
jgi:hypothetical protein